MTAQGFTERRLEPSGEPFGAGFRLQPGMIVTGVLAFLTVLGAAAGFARLFIGMGGTTGLNDSTSWGIWIGFDFGLIAFSGAAFTMAAVVHIFHLHQFQPALRPALLTGLLGYVSVLVILLLDLGRPDRFYAFFLSYNLHSPLFEICWCIVLYSTVLVLEVAPDFLKKFGWMRMRKFILWLMPVATIIGVTLSSLHQSTLGTLYLNMPHRVSPLWWTPILPILFFTSAVMAGLAMGILAYRVSVRIHGVAEEPRVITGLANGLVGVGLVYLAMRLGALVWNGELFALDWGERLTWILVAEMGGLFLIPLVLLAIPSLRTNSLVQWVAPLMVAAGVLFNRFSMTLFANSPVIAREAYSPSAIEWVSTIGIIAAAVLAWYACVRWLVRFDEDDSHGGAAQSHATRNGSL